MCYTWRAARFVPTQGITSRKHPALCRSALQKHTRFLPCVGFRPPWADLAKFRPNLGEFGRAGPSWATSSPCSAKGPRFRPKRHDFGPTCPRLANIWPDPAELARIRALIRIRALFLLFVLVSLLDFGFPFLSCCFSFCSSLLFVFFLFICFYVFVFGSFFFFCLLLFVFSLVCLLCVLVVILIELRESVLAGLPMFLLVPSFLCLSFFLLFSLGGAGGGFVQNGPMSVEVGPNLDNACPMLTDVDQH